MKTTCFFVNFDQKWMNGCVLEVQTLYKMSYWGLKSTQGFITTHFKTLKIHSIVYWPHLTLVELEVFKTTCMLQWLSIFGNDFTCYLIKCYYNLASNSKRGNSIFKVILRCLRDNEPFDSLLGPWIPSRRVERTHNCPRSRARYSWEKSADRKFFGTLILKWIGQIPIVQLTTMFYHLWTA